jgi:molecular chaperone DnaK
MEIGIDLGTTNSVAAFLKDGVPTCIPSAEGEDLVPSVVAFAAQGPRWVGRLARRQAASTGGPEITTVTSIKRRMGSAEQVETVAGGYTPQAISALILAKIKRDAEAFLGEPVEQAVITVPAYFNDTQRRATRDAGQIAGLEVLRIISEPTAAALAYGLNQSEIQTVVVWDLGGGTFDVSVLELGDGVFRVRAVAGDNHLGGDDWDARLVEFLYKEMAIRSRGEGAREPSLARRVSEAAEEAKIRLSSDLSARFRLPPEIYDRQRFREIEISREEFCEISSDLCERLVAPTRQALADADVDPLEVDRLLLVGGATRMPMIQELAREIFGREAFRSLDPDRVVALGAAVQAGILTGRAREVTLLDVTPLTLGFETLGGISTPLVRRNATIPVTESKLVTNACDDQAALDIHVLQGERSMAIHNHHLGTLTLDDVAALPRGRGRYEVVFHIDADGILQVEATDLNTELSRRVRIDSAHILSRDEIRRMLEEAVKHRATDLADAEATRAAIRADGMIAAAETVIEELRGAGADPDSGGGEELYRAIDRLRDALAREDKTRVHEITSELERQIREVKRRQAQLPGEAS